MSERTIYGFVILCAMILVVAGFSFGQTPDRHLHSDPAKALYEKSCYAHGYAHGYEDGFHNGDMDIHMGRGERKLEEVRAYKNPQEGYRSSFGDEKYFKSGYKQGFSEGYFDAVRGERFRAESLLIKASRGMTDKPTGGFSKRDFDAAFSHGYKVGRVAGLRYPLADTSYQYASSVCQSRMPDGKRMQERSYCDAFTRGFNIGFADGHDENLGSVTETASR